MFPKRYRNSRRLQKIRKVETDFILARLAGAGRAHTRIAHAKAAKVGKGDWGSWIWDFGCFILD